MMPPTADNPENLPDLFPTDVIRVETALSRFPIHRLGKKPNGVTRIQITGDGQVGEVKMKWEVEPQPGPLAYKLDTLIVNRRIEEARRPVPKVIKLGSLRQICRELGISEGKGTKNVRDAIYQNAQAFIKAKTHYKHKDGTLKMFEGGFTRYSVIFTGEQLPDGSRASAVYIVLNDLYIHVINGAVTRPLDYAYLKELSPAPQRFYEILSYQMYAALKHGHSKARLVYSEFCTYAPQTRYFDYDHVKKQMYKIHAPHRRSGYIKEVEFEQTTCPNQRPDWVMLYVPGPKARAEFRAFTKRGGPQIVEVEMDFGLPLPAEERRERSELERELIARGVTEKTAEVLALGYPEDRIRLQMEALDWIREKKPEKIADPAAYLTQAIRDGYALPKGFESKADKEKRLAERREKQRLEQESKRRKEAQIQREAKDQARVLEHWNNLTPEEQQELEARALEEADDSTISEYGDLMKKNGTIAKAYLRIVRDTYIKRILNIPVGSSE